MAITLLPAIISLSPPSHLFSFTTHSPSLLPPFLQTHYPSSPHRHRRRGRIASVTGSVAAPLESTSRELQEIYDCSQTWTWKGFSINFIAKGSGPPLLLVHGFGASVGHWRRNIGVLSENYTVYAIDLLGFGASDKPAGFSYTMEVWAQLILDFLDEIVKKPTILIGNSVGSLACVIAASVA